jgi:predicted glutamine amidotransferase
LCGIIGVASTEGSKNKSARSFFMKMGLDIDSWRGWESTGLALVPEASKEPPLVYKRALNGRDFIQLNKVDRYLDDMEKYSVAIGHNRAATTGRGSIVDHNAHPFQYGRITLVHNGHIRNTNELPGAVAGAQCLVDSAHVAFAMDANGEQETLEQIDGGFVLVWWNSDTSTLNIARNTERPLYMAFAAKENTFYWASELTALLHLLQNVEIDEDMGILFPTPGNWYQFDIKNLREYKKVPFVKRHGRQNHRTQIGPVGVQITDDMGDEEEAAWKYRMREEGRTSSTQVSSQADSAEIEDIRRNVANQRLKDVKASGMPTSKKRLTRAVTELNKLGITYNSLRVCTPLSWTKYKNQENLGSVIAKANRDGRIIEVLQVHKDTYTEYHAAGSVLVDCVNVRQCGEKEPRVIGIVNRRMPNWLEHKKNRAKPETISEELGSVNRDYDGPGGRKITLARFSELVRNGCGNCERVIAPKEHGTVLWVGSPECPVCAECASDPGVMGMLGIPMQQGNIH